MVYLPEMETLVLPAEAYLVEAVRLAEAADQGAAVQEEVLPLKNRKQKQAVPGKMIPRAILLLEVLEVQIPRNRIKITPDPAQKINPIQIKTMEILKAEAPVPDLPKIRTAAIRTLPIKKTLIKEIPIRDPLIRIPETRIHLTPDPPIRIHPTKIPAATAVLKTVAAILETVPEAIPQAVPETAVIPATVI